MSSYLLSAYSYYNIIDYIPHTVYFIPRTDLFYNWTFVYLNFPDLFLSSSQNLSLLATLFVLYVHECFIMFVHLV